MSGNDPIGSMDLGELRLLKEYGTQFSNINEVVG